MLVGYARVSTQDQNLDLQRDALEKAGCEGKLFTDQISGASTEQPGLEQALAFVRKGDTLVVWKLDRLGRSLKHQAGLAAARARGRQGGRPKGRDAAKRAAAIALSADRSRPIRDICTMLSISRTSFYRYINGQ